ncbi:MAG: hypothetical protein ACK51F_04860 [Rhodospirillales bacterium]|jgi:hypothetical protein
MTGAGAELFVPPSALDPVVRALTYPYPAPDHDFVFRNGGAVPVPALAASDRADRVPVLAIGSNRAPEQLQRKFADIPDAEIGVERVRLSGFDVVHSAHLSGYAALAATLHPAPTVEVDVSITWIPPRLMARMHATEGIGTFYDFLLLDGVALAHRDGGGARTSVFAYVCRLGALDFGGGPRGLAAVAARGRPYPALDQTEAQRALAAMLGADGALEGFVRANAMDAALRLAREEALAARRLPFAHAAARPADRGDQPPFAL